MLAAACGNNSSEDQTAQPTASGATSVSLPSTPPSIGSTVATSPIVIPSSTSSTTTVATPSTCSAAGMSRALEPRSALPAAVSATRQAIVDAAVRCDWDALSKLATSGPAPFMFTVGGTGDPLGYWKTLEADSPPRGLKRQAVLRALVTLLNVPSGSVDSEGPPRGSWIQWPAPELSKNVNDPAYAAVRSLYSDEEWATIERTGSYPGWRVGIRIDGSWSYFLAGD